MRAATCEAPSNIALVKYWGLRDLERMLPFNSSLSVTLDRARTRTTVRFDERLSNDVFVLNGRLEQGRPAEEVSRFLDRVRSRRVRGVYARVRSSNNFPTASGLASSASGFAALAGAASRAAGLSFSSRALSTLARYGSGSACRSVFGGFVEWRAGKRADGRDCFATPVFPARYWPALVDLVVLVRDAPEKTIRSARAMQATVATAPGYAERVAGIPARIAHIKRAIRERDPARLFPEIMEECDSFRSVCETSTPPLDYLTPTSRAVLETVRQVNGASSNPIAAYTHDAGAHVHVFTTETERPRVARALRRVAGVHRVLFMHAGAGVRFVASARTG